MLQKVICPMCREEIDITPKDQDNGFAKKKCKCGFEINL